MSNFWVWHRVVRSSAREEKLSVVSSGEMEVRSLDHSLQLLISHCDTLWQRGRDSGRLVSSFTWLGLRNWSLSVWQWLVSRTDWRRPPGKPSKNLKLIAPLSLPLCHKYVTYENINLKLLEETGYIDRNDHDYAPQTKFDRDKKKKKTATTIKHQIVRSGCLPGQTCAIGHITPYRLLSRALFSQSKTSPSHQPSSTPSQR